VTARNLLVLFDSVYVIALAAWLGSVLFFSFSVAPIIFQVLGAEAGAKFVRALFPRYYLWGAISGAVALPAFVAGPLCYQEYRGPMVGLQALVMIGGILAMLYGANSLTPAINRARDGGPAGQELFKRLHRRAVWLNGLTMVLGLALLVAFVLRPAPRTSGIIEMTPEERARYTKAVGRIIQDVEAKHGLRPPRPPESGDAASAEELIGAETVREIESYYDRKEERDDLRAGHPKATPPVSPR
jgi:Domain of unknown function (DUF4149)